MGIFHFFFVIFQVILVKDSHFQDKPVSRVSVSQIRHSVGAVSLRATWRVNYTDNDLAENLIASERRNLDEKLATIEGVHFFFSFITGTRTDAKTSRKEKDKLDVNQQGSSSDKKSDSMSDEIEDLFSHFYPGIAYFIAFTPSPTCTF